MGLGSEAYSARALSLVKRADDKTLADEILEVHHANLEATRRYIASRLAHVVEVMGKADAFRAAVFRACFPFRLRLPAVSRQRALDRRQGGLLEMQQRAMEKDDVVMVISFAPYSRQAIRVAEAAKAAGCKLNTLADSEASPIALMPIPRFSFRFTARRFPICHFCHGRDRSTGRTAC